MYKTLSYIGEKLNNSKILWGVGASILLNQYGLIKDPNDIDLFIDTKNIEKADSIFKQIGIKKDTKKIPLYSTKYFYEYNINGIDIDVMAGFGVNHSFGTYEYVFDSESISEYKTIYNEVIPFTSLEDWYVIYQLIPGRQVKVDLIEKYLFNNGIKKPFLLERALDGNLPMDIRKKINRFIKGE